MSESLHTTEFELRSMNGWPYYHLPAVTRLGIAHGFMTKSSDTIAGDPGMRERFVEELGADDGVIMFQEHGDQVHLVQRGERPGRGDGLIIVERHVTGMVKTADCLPVILYEPDYPLAAVIHAGWRGTVARIVEKAIGLIAQLGVAPARLGALIGPGIGPCCYHVGQDVVTAFANAGFGEAIFEKRNGLTYLDLKQANRSLLTAAGIARIHDLHLCTSCSPELFFSARRDGNRGRQISFVLLKG